MDEEIAAKLYMSREDALEHTGVTAKQLRQWREEGLIELELGSKPGRELKLTERDLGLLKVIKRLRDEGYPAATIKRMLSATEKPWAIDFTTHYWSYDLERWVDQIHIANDALATGDIEWELPMLLEMCLVAFLWRSAMLASSSLGLRQQRVREIVDRVLEADRDRDESQPPSIHSTLERTPGVNECVQYILDGWSMQRVRGVPDGDRLLGELAEKVHQQTALPRDERTQVFDVTSCVTCGKYIVGEFRLGRLDFCSEECTTAGKEEQAERGIRHRDDRDSP